MKKADYNDYRAYRADINKRLKKNDASDNQFRFTAYIDENRSPEYKLAISELLNSVGYYPFGFDTNRITKQKAVVFISWRDYKTACSGHDYSGGDNPEDWRPAFNFKSAFEFWLYYTTDEKRKNFDEFLRKQSIEQNAEQPAA